MTEKSQKEMPVYVPIHPALAASIAACPSKGLAIIAKDDGTNYAKEALGNMFREAVEAAGIPVKKKKTGKKGYTGHGLHKASATIAAESGASESELNAMFGLDRTRDGAALHEESRLKRLAARAKAKWTRPSPEDLDDASISYLQTEKERA